VTTHGAAAKAARETKAAHPGDYCAEPGCMWRVHSHRKGYDPCPRHQAALIAEMIAHQDAAEADKHETYVRGIEER